MTARTPSVSCGPRHAHEDSSSIIMELGVAYLWLGDYTAAWDHFDAANRKYPKHSAAFYEMAATAKWCMGGFVRSGRAVDWRLDCDFADAAGGVRCPLQLFFASVVVPGVFSRAEAERLLGAARCAAREYVFGPGRLPNLCLAA